MRAEVINPFLESARRVIEQVVQVVPSTGSLGVRQLDWVQNQIWIHIGLTGQLSGNVVFGIAEHVALRIVSVMMGGYAITEMDEMGRSAISELGNMISGNASALLFNQGVNVDITPPEVLMGERASGLFNQQALCVPLQMEGIGELDIQIMIS